MWDYLRAREVCRHGPRAMGIEITNRCNLNCIMCPRQQMSRPVGDMRIKEFEYLINQGGNRLEYVWLQDYGEPLLHPQVSAMIRICKQQGIRVSISTNATLLNEEIGRQIIESGLDYFMLALDGTSKGTYESVRKGADFDKVINNIKQFLATAARQPRRPFIVMQLVCMPETKAEVASFLREWNRPGVDAVRIRQVTYSINREGSNEERQFVNVRRRNPCFWLWAEPQIKWDGRMVPCCQDVNAELALGNALEEPFYELWNNRRMQHLRHLHIAGKADEIPLCRSCNMYQPTLSMALVSLCLPPFLVKKLTPKVETLLSRIRYR